MPAYEARRLLCWYLGLGFGSGAGSDSGPGSENTTESVARCRFLLRYVLVFCLSLSLARRWTSHLEFI